MSATQENPLAQAGAAGRQFVTFQVEKEIFGLPMAEVQEIIRLPSLIEVPLSPPSLRGIANLRGTVLPVMSLRRIFGQAEASADDATRIVVVNHGGKPVGFIVDRMSSVLTAEPEQIEDASGAEGTMRSELLRGVIKREAGMVLLLRPDSLAMQHEDRAEQHRAGGAGLRMEEEGARVAVEDDIQLVSFLAAGQEYAFPIADVREIVQMPGAITRVPQASARSLGVMTLRERLLPLISLRRLFGMPEAPLTENCRIVVVSVPGGGEACAGLVMDSVKEVLRVPRQLVEPMPALLADGGRGHLEAICRLESGRRLVTILSAARMFEHGLLGESEDREEEKGEMARESQQNALGNEEEEQFVIFRLAGEEYGVPIDAVQEIVRVPEQLTHVPQTPDFIEGVVNLRGSVLPVIDQRRRFRLADAERNDRQRIMVLSIGGKRTGFIVDQVLEVLRIARAVIGPAPRLSAEQARLIRRVANLEAKGRMVLLLEPGNLLEAGEIAALEAA